MGDFNSFGRFLIILGAILLTIGLFITLVGRVFPMGRLPGDILVRRGNFTFYFPIVTSIVLSVILTLLLNFFGRK